ncbi:MAG: ABC-type transport auxiliary lipoprotein family protein [Pseudomonadota bacterium]
MAVGDVRGRVGGTMDRNRPVTSAAVLRRVAQRGVAVVGACVLAGCAAATSLGPPTPPRTFDLGRSSTAVAGYRAVRSGADRLHVVVAEPTALRGLAGDRIAVRPRHAELAYFADAAWADTLPRLIEARLVEDLGRSGRFGAVGRAADRLDADVTLAADIRAFHVDLAHGEAAAHVDVHVRLIDARRGRVLTSRGFTARSNAGTDDVRSGVRALSVSVGRIMPQVTAWAGKLRMRSAPASRQVAPTRSRRIPPAATPDDRQATETAPANGEEKPIERAPKPKVPARDLLVGKRAAEDRTD